MLSDMSFLERASIRAKALDVTEEEFAFTIAQMHAVSLTIAEEVAVGTGTCAHPFAVAIGLEAVFPHIHEVVLVDVALVVVATDAGTG